ncbi:hypothetical protein CEXT_597071 [Caerostris extrusa]|uniref:Uncharacterized protein n=1 Tax=Caerostris extrusa TaxID=172846 RepID=A0AAV4XH75_CAEEX|nr:hypothetical protein CEXT_597071 [Caerostris extrusa]
MPYAEGMTHLWSSGRGCLLECRKFAVRFQGDCCAEILRKRLSRDFEGDCCVEILRKRLSRDFETDGSTFEVYLSNKTSCICATHAKFTTHLFPVVVGSSQNHKWIHFRGQLMDRNKTGLSMTFRNSTKDFHPPRNPSPRLSPSMFEHLAHFPNPGKAKPLQNPKLPAL